MTHITPQRRYNTPIGTYRLQLHAGFGFADVCAILPYLQELGISHLYLSPIFAAAPGSTHGYDVFNHNQVNPELGGLGSLYELGEELLERDMGLIIDIVPNHVGIAGGANPWWRDVLRYGRASRYAQYFDIDWEAQPQMTAGVLVWPILGRPFGAALEAGELRLDIEDNDLVLRYYENSLPLAPSTYPEIVGLPPLELRSELRDPAAFATFVDLLEGLRAATLDTELAVERFRNLLASEPAIMDHVRSRLEALNGEPGRPESFDRLDAILSAQHYRLTYWRVSAEEINYRRFFDINELAGIRVEREDVFEETHRLVLELVEQGIVTGVRIDHVDGLYDPAAYLARLRDRLRDVSAARTECDIPVYVEKILEEGEILPKDWATVGTTGYDFMAHADGLLVDRAGSRELTSAYEQFLGEPVRFREMVYQAKRQITQNSFAGEINVLALQLHRIAARHRRHRDNTLRSLRDAIETVLACFPVYRTYLVEGRPSAQDPEYIEHAVREARRRDPDLSSEALSLLEEVLQLRDEGLQPDEMEQRIHFRRRFQQLSSPVMAKGFEDTTLYRYNRLVSLNEVGSDPSRFGASPREVHAWLQERGDSWPRAMSASSTHDTKRGEDVRARLHLLSEMPDVWNQEVKTWARLNRSHRITLHGEPVPDPNTEYLIYQTLVGSLPPDGIDSEPDYRDRLHGYLEKALREAKVYTSWTNPDERYEAACHEFLDAILDTSRGFGFADRLEEFVEGLLPSAMVNTLSALTLKALAPGFPDFYQGTELPVWSLTDPDNRRPVDFELRQRLLSHLGDSPPDFLSPQMKLWLARRLLRIRANHSNILAEASYEPLETSGVRAESVFAFARRAPEGTLVVVLPRLMAMAMDPSGIPPTSEVWGDTTVSLPAQLGVWCNELTGGHIHATGQIACAEMFGPLPLAVLWATAE